MIPALDDPCDLACYDGADHTFKRVGIRTVRCTVCNLHIVEESRLPGCTCPSDPGATATLEERVTHVNALASCPYTGEGTAEDMRRVAGRVLDAVVDGRKGE